MNGLKRVVITGCGVYSALGFTPGELFDSLAAGRSAVVRGGKDEHFLPTAPAPRDPELFRALPRTLRRAMAPSACFTAMAGLAAMKDSGLTQDELLALNAGCAVGSTMGSVSALRDGYALVLSGQSDRLSPMHFFKSASHTTAFNLARTLGLNGAVYSPCSACASGLQAMGLGAALISAGQAAVMFCGGADETGSEVSGSFSLMYAHAPVEDDPTRSSQPFSVHRKGLVCGEGAARPPGSPPRTSTTSARTPRPRSRATPPRPPPSARSSAQTSPFPASRATSATRSARPVPWKWPPSSKWRATAS